MTSFFEKVYRYRSNPLFITLVVSVDNTEAYTAAAKFSVLHHCLGNTVS